MSKDLFKGIIKRRSGTDQRVCVDNWDQTYGAIATLIDSGLTAISVPFIVIRTHQNDAEYACSKSALSVQANERSCKHTHTHTFTHAHSHTHTHTPIHTCRCMHPSDVKYALSTFTFSVQANDCRGTHHAFHTRAHAHAGTHKNEVEYACSKFICSVQANARSCKHIHGRTHTCAHPYTRSMHAPNPHFQFMQVPADAHTYTQALTLVHTHTHACCYTHLNDVENACPESTFSIQANVCEGTQTHTNTHTHTHTRMLVFAHKLYPPAFTCTHQNDVMYAGPKSTL